MCIVRSVGIQFFFATDFLLPYEEVIEYSDYRIYVWTVGNSSS